jgi:hypothetical protein
MSLFVGTSGFSYASWKGTRYFGGRALPGRDTRYANRLRRGVRRPMWRCPSPEGVSGPNPARRAAEVVTRAKRR